MNALLFVAIFLQGVFAQPIGTITGVVRDANGKPQPSVRVAAKAVGENTEALVSIVQTDEMGRYRLEVSPGRYYILAGRVDIPTYYPGVNTPKEATAVSVTSGASTGGLDFAVVVLQLTGFLRDTAGAPLPGIQVAAVLTGKPPRFDELNTAITDVSGRYRLEVPPGLYSIVAGPKYYPEAARLADAVRVSADVPIRDSDFVVSDFAVVIGSQLKGKDNDLYLKAAQLVDSASYSQARLLFQTIMRTYPDSPLAPEAMYAFADSYYRQATLSAMTEALEGFNHYLAFFPAGPRAAEARQRILSIQGKPIP